MDQESGISEGEFIAKEGKMIRIRAKFQGDKIKELRITGDFFMHPEERIEELENLLRGVKIENVGNVIREVFTSAEYAGISPELVERGLREAWSRRK